MQVCALGCGASALSKKTSYGIEMAGTVEHGVVEQWSQPQCRAVVLHVKERRNQAPTLIPQVTVVSAPTLSLILPKSAVWLGLERQLSCSEQ